MELVKGAKMRAFEWTGTGKHIRAHEFFNDEQKAILKTLVGLGKLEHGNDSKRGGAAGEYYKPLESFNMQKGLEWVEKIRRWNNEAKLKIAEFVGCGDCVNLEKSMSGNYYKHGQKPNEFNYNERPKGLRRGSYILHRLNKKPTIKFEVFDGENWKECKQFNK